MLFGFGVNVSLSDLALAESRRNWVLYHTVIFAVVDKGKIAVKLLDTYLCGLHFVDVQAKGRYGTSEMWFFLIFAFVVLKQLNGSGIAIRLPFLWIHCVTKGMGFPLNMNFLQSMFWNSGRHCFGAFCLPEQCNHQGSWRHGVFDFVCIAWLSFQRHMPPPGVPILLNIFAVLLSLATHRSVATAAAISCLPVVMAAKLCSVLRYILANFLYNTC